MARAVLHGIAVSTGIAIGKGFFLNRGPVSVRHELVPLDNVEAEAARLSEALARVAADFEQARDQLPAELKGYIDLLNSHLLICTDPKLGDEAARHIREQRMNAEWALEESITVIVESFSRLPSPYIRDRIEDVRMVADRILQRMGGNAPPPATGKERGILLAYDLTPADAMGIVPSRVFSFAVEQGGKTSHTGILGRSLRIPAVVGVSGLGDEARSGDLIIVDGLRGQILVDPDEEELAEYTQLQAQFEEYEKSIRAHALLPAETEDGQRVAVLANIESAAEAKAMLASGGEGVGLVRTEFGYITRISLPTEEELYAEYAALAAALAPRKVTFRTLDLGGDKIFSGRKKLDEINPALGMRAIRYCLRHQDIFRTQLRAILRASAQGNVALMFPLISGLGELRLAKSILNEAKQELSADNIPFDADMPVGIMVELPAAVLVADALAKEVDFFSIGTNDLIQYSLGVDRGNRHVAYLNQPLHPAVVRSIKQVVDMAHKEGISVCVCGEMAADPYCLPILLGMPVDELSLAPQSIPAIKHFIRRSSGQSCASLLTHALSAPTVHSINNMARQSVYRRFPEDVTFFVSQLDADM
ncbi:MAG: phosphoenolpyruvate--protein phosphotransferase [Desulfovibrio sp.]|jgi:phosphotransferase system enzyme I (PtsI)|nr:phosphoenolpyruvate--protein phosphotransferase [Desulfovibrio sp.]